jgi:Na+-transporting NADH:ubiquinone oxidoreductase subunit C
MTAFRQDVRMSVFLIVLTAVCTVLLTSANLMYERVLEGQLRVMRMDILRNFGVTFTDDTFATAFEQYVDLREEASGTFYHFRGEPRQVTVMTAGSGLWSTIELLITIDVESLEMKELKVLSHGETPGLGGRIEEPWFARQFRGLDVSDGVKLVTQRTGATGEVDAISGATATSRSVMSIINRAISTLEADANL